MMMIMITNVTAKVNKNENSRSQIMLSHGYMATSGKLREKSCLQPMLES